MITSQNLPSRRSSLEMLQLIFLSMLEDEYLVGAKLSPTLEPEAVDLAEVCGALWCCPQTSSTEPPCWFWIVPHNDITEMQGWPRPSILWLPPAFASLQPGLCWVLDLHLVDGSLEQNQPCGRSPGNPSVIFHWGVTAPKCGHGPLLKGLVPSHPGGKLRYQLM